MRPMLAAAFVACATVANAEDRWMVIPKPPAMPEAASSGMAEVNGIQMYYATYGAGDPVLLIHGGLGNADIWANQVIDLMQDHLVIVADSRGHGRSTRTEEPFGYDLMASDYLALLDVLKVDKVDLVGWSDGGIIGLDIAMSHPERLDHLFAHAANITTDGVDPSVEDDPVFMGIYVGWMAEDYARLSPTPDQFDAFVEQISGMWASQPNWTDDQVKAITVPVAVVVGDHDEAILPAHTEKIAALIPGAKLVILPDASHFAMLQAPSEYTAAIRALIDG
ncbi:alpha/beta hydrolase [Tabrizicola sp.]|uniref:alpha/beta fold hydrolase n=1 Tax=Tabrizicola sp. TaxID=2005166 RepID=UPI001A41784B|nr:alpha/beta hydrolase [Tabrizicola sp.]MBL9074402.1 alpha/beta fold hydrolase [Tabrizicola sp.]